MKKILLLFAAVLLLTAIPNAWAQTTAPSEAMFSWGAIHKAPGEAVVLNFTLTDHFGDSTLTLPVEFRLEDKAGNLIYTNTVNVSAGKTVSAIIAIAPELRVARSTIEGDIYGLVGPEFRTIVPCVRVVFPPGPYSPVSQMFASLEVVDVLTGRVQIFDTNTQSGIIIHD